MCTCRESASKGRPETSAPRAQLRTRMTQRARKVVKTTMTNRARGNTRVLNTSMEQAPAREEEKERRRHSVEQHTHTTLTRR